MARLRKHDRVYTGNFGFATVYSMRGNKGKIFVIPDDVSLAYRANRARGTSELGKVVTVPLSFCTRLTLRSEQFVARASSVDYRLREFVIEKLNCGHSISSIKGMLFNVASEI